MNNPILNGHDNTALKKAEEGLVDSHFPRANMKRLLEEIDREYIQQHPFMKEEIEQLKMNEKKKKKIKIDSDTFLDVNTPLENECDYKKTVSVITKIDNITDEFIKNNRLSIEEMEKLPQMKKVFVSYYFKCSIVKENHQLLYLSGIYQEVQLNKI